jgi:Fic family protein
MINQILSKEMNVLTKEDIKIMIDNLIKRLQCEYKKKDRSGIYGQTQYLMAYNSNRIEGSRLSMEHTQSLFQTGTLRGDVLFRAKDVEETTGHFQMFNRMLDTYQEPLTQKLIKEYHASLKSGVFEDLAKGYPIGAYKNRKNVLGNIETTAPQLVATEMQKLLDWYHAIGRDISIQDLTEFHIKYERIHPFQDGNGRTGRIILFKECLRHHLLPFIIRDVTKDFYFTGLQGDEIRDLCIYFQEEQSEYLKLIREFLFVFDAQ